MKKKLSIAALLLCWPGVAGATDYYVRADGTAANKESAVDDLLANTAMNLTTAAAEAYLPGSNIYFSDAGGEYTVDATTGDALFAIPSSGDATGYIYYRNSPGQNPVFNGGIVFDSTGDWTEESANVWYASNPDAQSCRFVMFGTVAVGNQGTIVADKASLAAAKNFWHDTTNDFLYVYSEGNPKTIYGNITVAKQWYAFYGDGKDYVDISGITAKYFSKQAIGMIDGDYWKVHDFDISWGGGFGNTTSAVGNGVQLAGSSAHLWIYSGTVDNYFDAGVTVQTFSADEIQDFYIYDVEITNSGCGIEANAITTDGARIKDGWIHDFIILDAGSGWSGYGTGATGNSLHGKGVTVGTGSNINAADNINIYDGLVDGFKSIGIRANSFEDATYPAYTGTVSIKRCEVTGGTGEYTTDGYDAIQIHGGTSASSDDDTHGVVAYNYIHDNVNTRGIYTPNNSGVVSYHGNTVDQRGVGAADTYPVYRELASTNTTLRNNILMSDDQYLINDSATTTIPDSDYNVLYRTDAGVVARLSSTDYANLAAWQAASGGDANSLTIDPRLDAQGRPRNPAVWNAGTFIDGMRYYGSGPAVGAWDFSPGLRLPGRLVPSVPAAWSMGDNGRLYSAPYDYVYYGAEQIFYGAEPIWY